VGFSAGRPCGAGRERGGHGGPRSGPPGPGSFSGDSVGQSFSRDQRGAEGFRGTTRGSEKTNHRWEEKM
jgi:hypothetical protein